MVTRRDVLLGGAAAGLDALALSACGSTGRPQTASAAVTDPVDGVLLNSLLAIEQRAIAAYTAAGPLLAGFPQRAAGRFLSQELRHAGELRKLVKQAGVKPHDPAPYYDLGRPRGPAEVLTLLHEVERQQLDAYLAALPRVSDPVLRQVIASIMANDAQHLAVLRTSQGLPVLAEPLLAGTG